MTLTLIFLLAFVQQCTKCVASRAKNRDHGLYLDIASPLSHAVFGVVLWVGFTFGVTLGWVLSYTLGAWLGDRVGVRIGRRVESRLGARADSIYLG